MNKSFLHEQNFLFFFIDTYIILIYNKRVRQKNLQHTHKQRKHKMFRRYVFTNGKEQELILHKDQYVYIMGFEPFRPIRVKVKDTFSSWVLFYSAADCTRYY